MRPMGKLLAGVLVGAALAAGAAWLWSRSEPCLARCGAGTQCRDHACVVVTAAAAPPAPKEKHRRARRDSAAAPEVHLKPGDEKMLAEGDALGRPQKLDLSEPDARELSQEDLDGVF